MSWWWTEDPSADFARHDRKQTAWLNSLPKCSICKEPIQQERAFEKDGFWICDECYENNQRMVIDA
jgi:formylmethanofuran dehydrogenase subunit E